jgi:anti-anti-sigma factor
MSESLQVHVFRANGVIVVDVRGELDAGTSEPVVDAVEAAALFGPDVIVVDTTALTFVDSGGRRALDRACRRARAVFVPGQAVKRFDRLLARALRTPGGRGTYGNHGAPTLAAATGR